MLGVLGWLALTVHGLDSHMSGLDKEIIFNKSEHDCFKTDIEKGISKSNVNERDILINRLDIVAIKHELELEIVEENDKDKR